MTGKQLERHNKNIKNINQKLKEIIKDSFKKTNEYIVISGLRTAKEQNEAYKNKASPLDGYKKLSKHQTGKAFDFAIIKNNEITYEVKYYLETIEDIEKSAKKLNIKIKSGKNFKLKDFMHIELEE